MIYKKKLTDFNKMIWLTYLGIYMQILKKKSALYQAFCKILYLMQLEHKRKGWELFW